MEEIQTKANKALYDQLSTAESLLLAALKYSFNQYGYRRLDAIHKLEWGGPSHFLVSGCPVLRTDEQ